MSAEVVVLGGGLAGLGFALNYPDCEVYEAAPHPGGHARSTPLDGVYFDQGAHISHTKDAGFRDRIARAAGRVVETCPSVVQNRWAGNWYTYPVQNNLRELPVSDRIKALTDLVRAHAEPDPNPGRDYRAWCEAQYGRYLTDTFYDRYTAKYWRVPMAELATDWLSGRLVPSQLDRIVHGAFAPPDSLQTTFSAFRYPAAGGFFGFFERLYSDVGIRLNERAVDVDWRARRVTFASGRVVPYDRLVSTIPLPDLVAITRDVPPAVRDEVRHLRCTQLVCVNIIVGRPVGCPSHWFYIYDDDIDASRVSLPGNLAPGSAGPGRTAFQAEVFRRDDEPVDPDLIAERTVREVGRVVGFAPSEVTHVEARHVRRAYTIATHARAAAAGAILSWLGERGIQSVGLFGRWKFVWSDDAFRQGVEAAHALEERVCPPT